MGNKLDLIETILKDDLEISLSSEENTLINELDDDIKKEIYDLVKNPMFIDDIELITKSIIFKSHNLSLEQQQYIKTKCEERVKKLKKCWKMLDVEL